MRSNPQQDIGEDVKGVLDLKGRKLDVAVALTQGWYWARFYECGFVMPPDDHPNRGAYPGEAERYDGSLPWFADYAREVPHYSTSLDAIRPVVEATVNEFGYMYVHALEDAVKHSAGVVSALSCLLATAEDHCRAVLLCHAEKEKKG